MIGNNDKSLSFYNVILIMYLFLQSDQYFHFEASTEALANTDVALKNSYSYWWLNGEVNSNNNIETEKISNYLVGMMRIERYYAGIREDLSPLVASAKVLLERQDYTGFFKACGPNYVRAIRRAQEVTAIFQFESSTTDVATEYQRALQTNYGYTSEFQSKQKYLSINQSLRIKIKAYGLGLTEQGADVLVPTSLEEFQKVMKFAYNQLTKSPFADHVGMVYGMEVAPWIENVEFQIQAKIGDEAIDIPLPKSLIPKAIPLDDTLEGTVFANDEATRALFTCKEPTYSIDKYGYCCEPYSLYDPTVEQYLGGATATPETSICKPVRTLDPSVVKENMASNGEFIARLDSVLRRKMNGLSVLEGCISAINAIPETYDHYFIKSQDTNNYDKEMDNIFTVFDMRMSIDPFGDFVMVKHMAQELDEYLEMFYSPCLSAIYGMDVGTSSTRRPTNFMAYPWYFHPQCNYLSCLATGMRWDRANGGCTPDILSGDQAGYSNTKELYCAKDPETNQCKNDSCELDNFHTKVTTCWNNVLPTGSVNYFIEHFCMPQMSGKKLDDANKELLVSAKESCQSYIDIDCSTNIRRLNEFEDINEAIPLDYTEVTEEIVNVVPDLEGGNGSIQRIDEEIDEAIPFDNTEITEEIVEAVPYKKRRRLQKLNRIKRRKNKLVQA